MRRRLAVLGAATALALVPRLSLAVMHHVQIQDNVFSPAAIVVAEGDSITWTHLGFNPHTVDQNAEEGSCLDMFGGFGSGMMIPGDTFVWVAAGLGDAYYHCDFHCPPMFGEITVEESTPAETATWGSVKALYH